MRRVTLVVALAVTCGPVLAPRTQDRGAPRQTEWVMFTSGTTGAPKMVQHSLAGLTAAIKRKRQPGRPGGLGHLL